MKKLLLTAAVAALLGTATASAAENSYVILLKEAQSVSGEGIVALSDRVYLAPTYEAALSVTPADNISGIFEDEPLNIREEEFEIEADEKVSLFEELSDTFIPNDPYYGRQWYLPAIKAESVWQEGLTGAGVKVALMDTGINPVHVDLVSKVKDNFNTITPSAPTNTNDTFGHGTMVAGIVAATNNNNTCIAGITDGAELSVIKIAENGTSKPTLSSLLAAITKAIEFDCDVVNISLGWVPDDTSSDLFKAIQQEITRGANEGIIFVASAGNVEEGTTESVTYYPAAYDNVISVASMGRRASDSDEGNIAVNNGVKILTEEPSAFSAHNDKITCAAPGYRITSTFIAAKKNDGTYTDPLVAMATSDGTSFAAPMVASAAVIAKELDPTVNQARFEEYLKKSVKDVYTEGYDEYTGYGMLDIEKLIAVILEDITQPTPEPTPEPTPTPMPIPLSGFEASVTKSENGYTVMTMFDEAAEDFDIICAAYSGGRLVGVKRQSANTGAMGINFRFATPQEADTVAVMAWADGSIYPLWECMKQEFVTPEPTTDPTEAE